MEQPNNKRLVLTSVNQIITLVRQNPMIMASVPKLNIIAQQPEATSPKKACNCGARRNIQTDNPSKQIAEQILSSLTPVEFMQIKNVLGLQELCYYKRNIADNSLELVCV